MLNNFELEKYRSCDICSIEKSDLVDLCSVEVNRDMPLESRMSEYIKAVKNPYLFRVGDVGVKINCIGNKDLMDAIVNIC